MGSKSRHAKEILQIILKDRKPDQWYVEPFVGGANVIDKVEGKRLGADINKYVVALLIELSHGWNPPEFVSETAYKEIQSNKDKYEDFLVGYVGFQLSYGAKFFGGYRRDSVGKRDYSKEAYNNVVKQIPNLEGVIFKNCSYLELSIPENSLIYCDPPFKGTTKYKEESIDHNQFWQWCREKSLEGHTVYISEYNAPDDFECVWEKKVNSSMTQDTGAKKATEKLFKWKGE
jgi:DNA adenine methylase